MEGTVVSAFGIPWIFPGRSGGMVGFSSTNPDMHSGNVLRFQVVLPRD